MNWTWMFLVLGVFLVHGEDVRTDDQLIEQIVSDLSVKGVPAVDIKALSSSDLPPPSTKTGDKPDTQAQHTDGGTGEHGSSGQVMAQQGAVQGGHQEGSPSESMFNSSNEMFIVTVCAAGLAGLVGILMAGVCYYKFRSHSKGGTEVEYPAYGDTGPQKDRAPSPGDRKLAQSAQMYHYQHQKQQMIAMEKANGDMKHDASDDESEEDNVEGDYTVYECPGLAPTGEMEVKNPLFRGDDMTPVNPDLEVSAMPHRTNGDLPGNEGH